MHTIDGAIQHYAWGDPDFLPDLLGEVPDGRPWAEWWLGTHPSGPARLADGRPLVELSGPLPYLLKVLAVNEPLSMQVHPNAEQAIDGHRRGVYPDDQAKPELVVALTPFDALCGLRPDAATRDLLTGLGADRLAATVAERGPGGTVRACLLGELDRSICAEAVAACRAAGSEGPAEARWISRLDDMYPGEASVIVALLLNHVALQPGQALRLDAGNLHAYLSGVGVELMGASDNVVRAGLTPKFVDVDELLKIFDPTPLPDPVLPTGDGYDLPAAKVRLVRLAPGEQHRSTGREIVLDLAGRAGYLPAGDTVELDAGGFVVVETELSR